MWQHARSLRLTAGGGTRTGSPSVLLAAPAPPAQEQPTAGPNGPRWSSREGLGSVIIGRSSASTSCGTPSRVGSTPSWPTATGHWRGAASGRQRESPCTCARRSSSPSWWCARLRAARARRSSGSSPRSGARRCGWRLELYGASAHDLLARLRRLPDDVGVGAGDRPQPRAYRRSWRPSSPGSAPDGR